MSPYRNTNEIVKPPCLHIADYNASADKPLKYLRAVRFHVNHHKVRRCLHVFQSHPVKRIIQEPLSLFYGFERLLHEFLVIQRRASGGLREKINIERLPESIP